MKLPTWLHSKPNPPLVQAVIDGRIEDLDELIQANEDVNSVDQRGVPALHRAASHVWPDAVKLLLNAGADPTALDRYGRTAAHVASQHGRAENLKILLDAGVPFPELPVQVLLSPMSCHLIKPRTP
jgi:ankyrin repeat protein